MVLFAVFRTRQDMQRGAENIRSNQGQNDFTGMLACNSEVLSAGAAGTAR